MTKSLLLLFALVMTAIFAEVEGRVACGANGAHCAAGQVCCLSSGTAGEFWACCPYENGVCCANGMSCCPSEYSCGENGCPSGFLGVEGKQETLTPAFYFFH